MPTTPPTITALPDPPSRADPDNFDDRSDALFEALPDLVTEQNAVAANVYANAVEGAGSATAAATSASAAATSATGAANSAQAAATAAGAALWVSGASYTANSSVVYSTVGRKTYRAKTTHSGVATDPANDQTNWGPAWTGSLPQKDVSTATFNCIADVDHRLIGALQQTLTLPTNPPDGTVCAFTVVNGRRDALVISGDAAAAIDGVVGGQLLLDFPGSYTEELKYYAAGNNWSI